MKNSQGKYCKASLPNCPSYIAHPQGVWYITHWMPIFQAMRDENARLRKAIDFAYELGATSFPLYREDQNKMLDALYCAQNDINPKTREKVTP